MIAKAWVEGHFPEASDSEKAHLIYAYAAGRDFGLWQAQKIVAGARCDMSEWEAAAVAMQSQPGVYTSSFAMPEEPGIYHVEPPATLPARPPASKP